MADRHVPLPPGVGGVGGSAGLDVLVDGLQLPGGGWQVPGVEQCLDFEVGDEGPGTPGLVR